MDRLAGGQGSDSSPVKILSISPLKTGRGQLVVEYYHAFYPEGVREKSTQLTVLTRGADSLVGIEDGSRIYIFQPLTRMWLESSFVREEISLLLRSDDPAACLEMEHFVGVR